MSRPTVCDQCGQEIEDPEHNVEMAQLTTWEGEGGLANDFVEVVRDFCNKKCTAKWTYQDLLNEVNKKKETA